MFDWIQVTLVQVFSREEVLLKLLVFHWLFGLIDISCIFSLVLMKVVLVNIL